MALMLMSTPCVLHRDKPSWFCHIEAPTLRFLVWTLRVLGEDGFRVGNWALQQLMKQAAAAVEINS
jgi:hypothetical protein